MECSVDHLVSIRKCIKSQIDFFEDLKDDCTNINNNFFLLSCDYHDIFTMFNQQNDINVFKNRVFELRELLEVVNKKINETCEHCYCEDYIDINDYTTKYVKYCEKCWTNFDIN